MQLLIGAFWTLVILIIALVIHEGGHFLFSHLFGVRVTEFSIGMPSKHYLSKMSERAKTKFMVTPNLIGGYARIAGMGYEGNDKEMALVLSVVNARGTISIKEMSEITGLDHEIAEKCLIQLYEFGSISTPEKERAGFYPLVYSTTRRDCKGNTFFDNHDFDRKGTTEPGEPYFPRTDGSEFFASELKRTYQGQNAVKKIIMLLGGIFNNLVTGFIVLVAIIMIIGTNVISTSIASVSPDTPAAEAGIVAGDQIVSFNNVEYGTDQGGELLVGISQSIESGLSEIPVTVSRNDENIDLVLQMNGEDKIGVVADYHSESMGLIDATKSVSSYLAQVGVAVASLLNPAKASSVLSESSSVVGIAQMAGEVSGSGIAPMFTLFAIISISLGFMNLLPIPPLDGGKILIEIIQVITKKPISMRIQALLSYIGILLFAVLFIYLLLRDIFNIFI